MSLFGWREQRRIAELEARDEVRLARIAELEELIVPSDEYSLARRAELAGRVIDLERQVKAKDNALQLVHQRLDDAIRIDALEDTWLDNAGARERARRGGETS